MGKQTIIESIKEWLAGMCWEYFLKLNNLTEEKYFKQIAEQSNSATAGVRQTVSSGDVLLAEKFTEHEAQYLHNCFESWHEGIKPDSVDKELKHKYSKRFEIIVDILSK